MTARELFHGENFESSNADERAFQKDELIFNVTEDILITMEDLHVNKQELARRLGKSRSFVSQVLGGARNMTLGSLSDICFALDCKVEVKILSGNSRNRINIPLEGWIQIPESKFQKKEIGAPNVIIREHKGFWKNANDENRVA